MFLNGRSAINERGRIAALTIVSAFSLIFAETKPKFKKYLINGT